jgi:hypothetical protein
MRSDFTINRRCMSVKLMEELVMELESLRRQV